MFKIATGWLGWPASDAWDTPMVEIIMAWESKRQFMIDTNPHGSSSDKPAESKKVVAREVRMGFRVAAMNRNKDCP